MAGTGRKEAAEIEASPRSLLALALTSPANVLLSVLLSSSLVFSRFLSTFFSQHLLLSPRNCSHLSAVYRPVSDCCYYLFYGVLINTSYFGLSHITLPSPRRMPPLSLSLSTVQRVVKQ